MNDEYCECGNHYDNCTCVRCDFCRTYFPQTKMYNVNDLNICESCKEKRDKGSANFNINQQSHGGQSVTQPAPNCEDATSPC